MEIKQNKIFFIGIGGIGISALARMLHLEGKEVSGSDIAESEVTRGLQSAGIRVLKGQSIDLIPTGTELIAYSNAIKKLDDGFFAKLNLLNIPLVSYPELLGNVTQNKRVIAISGTHGKTTTTAMIGTILIDLGADPTVLVGSLLVREKSNFVAGKSDIFVTEADEYQRSFLALAPKILVINNLDLDHLDYFKDLADIQSAFRELALKVPEDGAIVCNPNNEHIIPVLQGVAAKVVDYTKISEAGIEIKFPGIHNIENAKVALAIAEFLGLSRADALVSLANFAGIWRRFEYKGETEAGAIVYDDYAHNPQKIVAALSGVRALYPDRKIYAVFQPHLFSRTKSLLNEFGKSFGQADEIVLLPIYPARELPDSNISSRMLAEKIEEQDGKVSVQTDFIQTKEYLNEATRPGDVIIILGAGDITDLASMLVAG